MFKIPDYYYNVSLRLSEVFGDIGVNEEMLLIKRHNAKLKESFMTIPSVLTSIFKASYILGSQIEGTTTRVLKSDEDILICDFGFNVIDDVTEWIPGFQNVLVVKHNNTCPGYCLLQPLREDAPLPVRPVSDESQYKDVYQKHFSFDIFQRLLFKNTYFNDFIPEGEKRNGPAITSKSDPDFLTQDTVLAYPYNSLPAEVRDWFNCNRSEIWPFEDMEKAVETYQCFVVPVGKRGSENEKYEWRISTSLLERSLMFSLNISQIRSYILMKMILKIINTGISDECHITSYMCKTVLFYTVQNSQPGFWQESNLLSNFAYCISILNECIKSENCPHFLIHGNNLMVGKFSPEVKVQLLKKLKYIWDNLKLVLLGIQTDDLGQRLQLKLNIISQLAEDTISSKDICLIISSLSKRQKAQTISQSFKLCLPKLSINNEEMAAEILLQYLYHLAWYYLKGTRVEQTACKLLEPLLYSSLGSVLASQDIAYDNPLSPDTFELLCSGLNSDNSSGKLKMASALYCSGQLQICIAFLRFIAENYKIDVIEPVCGCYSNHKRTIRKMFCESPNTNDEQFLKQNAMCIVFLPQEWNCVPKELQYEMFRNSADEELNKTEIEDVWMNRAVVDSLPYIYFLQYKASCSLSRHEDKELALKKLQWSIYKEENLSHKETALNLLGQCMELENRTNDAFICYIKSYNLQPSNNAARFHICKLLAKHFN